MIRWYLFILTFHFKYNSLKILEKSYILLKIDLQIKREDILMVYKIFIKKLKFYLDEIGI